MIEQTRDLQLMFKRYCDKASKGNKYAMMYVADCFLYGWGTSVDIVKYKEYLNKAASMGVSKAIERLFYEALGMSNCLDAEKILTLWGTLSENGKCECMNNYKKTSDIYNALPQKSVQGMIEAFSKDRFPNAWACEVALCYQFGYGVEKNTSKAAKIIVDSLGTQYDFPDEIANVLGLYDIGDIAWTGVSDHLYELMCKIDILDTLDSLERPNQYAGYRERLMIFAACTGNVTSQTMMAHLYLNGEIGFIKNNEYVEDADALRWLLTSLYNGGDGEDHDVLPALALLAGELEDKCDYLNAFKAIHALAEYGFIPAYRLLGTYYYKGFGVQKDYMQAGQWWLKGAQSNDEDAISVVNSIIEMGNGDYWTGINKLIADDSSNDSRGFENESKIPSQGTFMSADNSDYMQKSYDRGVCYFHASQPSVGQCVKCGKNVCKDCAESYKIEAGEYAGKILCYSCCEELVQENVSRLAANKKQIILTFILTFVGAVVGGIFGVSSTGDATMTFIFICIGATFCSFVKDFFKSIGQAVRVIHRGGGAGGELAGLFFFIFKLIYLMLKSIVVAFVKIIKYSIYLAKTSKALATDSASLQEMRDYMEYTKIAFANKGVDVDTLINQNSQLNNNTYAQNYRKNGEAFADEMVRNATTRIAENGKIIRSFAA